MGAVGQPTYVGGGPTQCSIILPTTMSYVLVNELHAHTGPVRCLNLGLENELVSGCQADAPCVKRWKVRLPRPSAASSSSSSSYSSSSLPELECVDGSEIMHNHWVVSCTTLSPGINSTYPQGLFITGCMDSTIRVYDPNTNELLLTLEGHQKGVISFSWTSNHKLISGSWDGTARIWDLDLGGACLMELTGHENGVNVLSLPSGQVLTTSTGESVDSKPANFQLRLWDPSDGKQLGESVEDHEGPIRGICGLPGLGGFATCGNDGNVLAYHVQTSAGGATGSMDLEGKTDPAVALAAMKSIDTTAFKAISKMTHVATDPDALNFVLACTAIGDDGQEVVSCGEDGSVYIWDAKTGQGIQRISLPSCVWCVVAVPGTDGDFLTGSHDGVIRWFSRNPEYQANVSALHLTEALSAEVAAANDKKKKGPSSEELAKCTKWEDRGSQMGKSEGTVMVFNKQGKMIAAQMTSGNWVEIGEVTGTGDSGVVCGVQYDHVMPVEIDGPGGVPRTLQLGFNDMENPFIAAQRFINQNELQQSFLAQIADWILQRSGRQETPTLGGVVGDPTAIVGPDNAYRSSSAPSAGSGAEGNGFTNTLLGYKTVSDIPPLGKLLAKIQEFSEATTDVQNMESMIGVLQDTSRYHVSTVRREDVASMMRLLSTMPQEKLFPVYDVARMLACHPSGSVELSKSGALTEVLSRTIELLQRSDTSQSTILTALRFLGNCFRFDELRVALLVGTDAGVKTDDMLINIIVSCHNNCDSMNKSIRSAVANITCNLALALLFIPELKSMLFNTQETLMKFMGLMNEQLDKELDILENIFKVLCAMGTLANKGGSLIRDKMKGMQGVVDLATILSIVKTNWEGRSNDLVDVCIRELLTLVK